MVIARICHDKEGNFVKLIRGIDRSTLYNDSIDCLYYYVHAKVDRGNTTFKSED